MLKLPVCRTYNLAMQKIIYWAATLDTNKYLHLKNNPYNTVVISNSQIT